MIFKANKELPAEIDFFRHVRSQYTKAREDLHSDPQYPEFHSLYQAEYSNRKPSTRLKYLATTLRMRHPRTFPDPYPPLADTTDSQKLGEALREQVQNGTLRSPDVIVVAPLMRTWLTFAGIQTEFPELAQAIEQQKVIIDLGGLSNKRLKQIVRTDGLMTEDWRIAGKNYGDISEYPEEDIYFALNWREQNRRSRLGEKAEFLYKPPHGENMQNVMNRVKKWEDYIVKKYHGKVVWVFGQLDTIMAITAVVKGLQGEAAAEEFLRLRRDSKPTHGGLTRFISATDEEGNQRYVLQDYNRTLRRD